MLDRESATYQIVWGAIPRLGASQRAAILVRLGPYLRNPEGAERALDAVDLALNNYAMALRSGVDHWAKKDSRSKVLEEIESLEATVGDAVKALGDAVKAIGDAEKKRRFLSDHAQIELTRTIDVTRANALAIALSLALRPNRSEMKKRSAKRLTQSGQRRTNVETRNREGPVPEAVEERRQGKGTAASVDRPAAGGFPFLLDQAICRYREQVSVLESMIAPLHGYREFLQHRAQELRDRPLINERHPKLANRAITFELGEIWKQFTGRKASLSNQEKDGGPFARFANTAARFVDPKYSARRILRELPLGSERKPRQVRQRERG